MRPPGKVVCAMSGNELVSLATIRRKLGDEVAERIIRAVSPALEKETAAAARRYILDVPGHRIRRLKDRAAFAAAMAELVRSDSSVRRRALSFVSRQRRRSPRVRPVHRKTSNRGNQRSPTAA